jgi:hypothetical protein
MEITNKDDLVETKNAFDKVNGLQQLATTEQVKEFINAIKSFLQSPHTDLRPAMRIIEQELLTVYAGKLIGSQCLDLASKMELPKWKKPPWQMPSNTN